MNTRTPLTLAAYIATIPAANLLITHLGPVPVGFGQMAPAGVFMAGLALVLRDLLSEYARWQTIAGAIAAGAVLSYLVASPALAVASAAAFGVAELADWAVYRRLRARGLLTAVWVSNAVGLVVDSVLFLHLAFGSLDYLPGQVVAKVEMTALAVLALWALRRRAVSVS